MLKSITQHRWKSINQFTMTIIQALLKICIILESATKPQDNLTSHCRSITNPFQLNKKLLVKITLQSQKLITISVSFRNFLEIFKSQDNLSKKPYKFSNCIISMTPQSQFLVIFISTLDQFILINKILKSVCNILTKLKMFLETFLMSCIQNLLIYILVKQELNSSLQEISPKQENILTNQLKAMRSMHQTTQTLM